MEEDFESTQKLPGKETEKVSMVTRCSDHREHLWEQNLESRGAMAAALSRKASRLAGPRLV